MLITSDNNLTITEKEIKEYIEYVDNKHQEQKKIQHQCNASDYSFSRMLEYGQIPNDPNLTINIEFKDTTCDIHKKFLFDFTRRHIKGLYVKNASFSDTQFANFKADTITFYECQIDKIQLGDNIECNEFVFSNCVIDQLEFINPESKYKFENVCFNFYHCQFKDIKLGNIVDAVEFGKDIKFIQCEFKNLISFHKAIFNKQADFSGITFSNGVDFSQCHFTQSVSFNQCIFEKTASFYGAKFEKAPNFSQAQFRGSLNLVNANLDFDFENVKDRIQNTYDSQHKKKPLEYIANDFRDSFRLCKSTLIKDNNLLDASNFHRVELYCKEIELTHKENKTLKGKIDRIVLKFYRLTSDHHTDLLKSFHSLLLVIGIFGLLSYIVIAGFTCCYGGVWYGDPHALSEFYNLHIKHFVLTHKCCVIMALLNMIFITALLVYCAFKIKCNGIRKISISISYFITFAILITSPKYLIPAIGIFTDKRGILDPLSTIGAIYTILFALMLYSFIKTARKNSIIPH